MKIKSIKGVRMSGNKTVPTIITVRYTADEIGKSLSLSDDEKGIMLQIPLEAVEHWFKHSHGKKRGKKR